MRKSSSMPGWRALASRYCCIIGVMASQQTTKAHGWQPVGLASSNESSLNDHSLRPIAERAGHAYLAHRQAVARRVVGDFGHVMAHQQEAAAAGALQVLGGHRVGHVVRV